MSDIITALSWINDVIFASLVNTILQMTILISVVALFIWIFRIRTPTIRYSLWLFVLFALITLPLLTPFVSQIDFAQFRHQTITGDGADGRPMMEPTYAGELSEVSSVLPSESAAKTAVSREMDVSLINPVSVAYFIWLAVMLFMLLITILAYMKLRKLRACSSDVKDSAALEMLSQLKRRIGIRKPVALKASPEIYTPMSLGIFSAVIIVPSSVMDDVSRDELEMILAHELAHIKRHDYLVNFLQNTMRAIFFFHPLFHLMNRCLTKEREHICDDWVIDITKQRNGYARCIVSLLERVAYRPAISPVTIAMAERKRDIPGRIDMIVDRKREVTTSVSKKALIVILTVACLSLPIIGGIELVRFAGAQALKPAQIAFLFQHDQNAKFEIYIMDADGENPRNLTNHPAEYGEASWSPDGRSIAFHSGRDDKFATYVMDADGKNPRWLADRVLWPVWSPDSQSIAFTSTRDDNLDVYVMDADGKNERRLTNNPAWDFAPSWSPDSQSIAFTTKRDGDLEIYVMDADGKNQRNLTNNPNAWDDEASWSPDGQSIAFGSYRNMENWEIYIMDADGKNQRNLTNSATHEWNPTWFDPAFAYSVSPAGKLRSTWGEIKSLLSPR